jgi:hypothetical protein
MTLAKKDPRVMSLPLLAVCFPVPQIIARFIHGSGSNPFRNKIPTDGVLRRSISIRPSAIGAVRN